MGSYPLLLNLKGVFQLVPEQYNNEQKNNVYLSKLSLLNTVCLVSRDCYWEHVVSYPTSNLIEVKNIIQSEIATISPLGGQTSAFIIHIGNKKTIVLYCCFSDALLSRAKSFNLWRLIPESLPLYREFHKKSGVYSINSSMIPVSQLVNDDIEGLYVNKIVIKVGNEKLASLPILACKDTLHSELILQESEGISSHKYSQILKKYTLLDALDYCVQVNHFVKEYLSTKKSILPYIYMFLIGFWGSYFVGKSLWLLWHHDHLTDMIADHRSEAADVIKRSNSLKKMMNDINQTNMVLHEHLPKTPILKRLKNIVADEGGLEFDIISINPTEIQLVGLTQSSTSLLSLLSKVPGVTKVEFLTPPTVIQNQGERFNIYLKYESVLYADYVEELQ